MLLIVGVVVGALAGSAGLIGLMVFFRIKSSVSPANLWPMLGNLFTMLCVSDVDVDGRLLRDDCAVREVGKSNATKDVFNNEVADVKLGTAAPAADDDNEEAIGPNNDDDDDDVDNDEVPGVSGANADGFVRLFSNNSLPP